MWGIFDNLYKPVKTILFSVFIFFKGMNEEQAIELANKCIEELGKRFVMN